MEELEGKLAYKKRGFFSGLVGVIHLNTEHNSISKYYLEYKDGTKSGFNKLSDIELFVSEYNNIELWKLAENGSINEGDIFKDQEDNYIIFTGKSFQSYYEEDENTYVGLCVGDKWEFVRNEYTE